MASNLLKIKITGIEEAIAQLKEIQRNYENKQKEFLSRLADIGVDTAKIRFAGHREGNDSPVEVGKEESKNGFWVYAKGEQVAFIEFGAGVFYNGAEGYKGERPPGIVGIGEYGKGKGKQDSWGYYDDAGELQITHGTMAANAMFYASQEMQRKIQDIAKEVFG